ncbi:interferon-inducible double-stranded RNA-dependent protein kinase activator A homolog [Chanos chanos]|uniref:Interferon-inducible double-stranded RNA-dependent protein kinase activator A homolog n=1 Tax=Chanos chanos TaxID=29144 RepID=A0A6J2WBI6_CHACN|nr:interferon-inducible double-stranded RNA-dependent protein kinase activator A [Chanos chanos]
MTEECLLNSRQAQVAGPEKTPIHILHEYGTKTGNLPVFVMEKAEGAAHQPNFVFTVTVGDITCTGQGVSKKIAKHQAAEAALKMLESSPQANLPMQKAENDGCALESGDLPNPVGELQELAMQRGWHLPEYTVCMEAGPPHMKEFTVTCKLETLSQTGVGNSKKLAKRAAAEKILEELRRLSGGSQLITWTPKPSVCLEELRNSSSEKISLLRRTPLNVPNADYIRMLREVSEEQGFEVSYHDIDELTVSGQYQCLTRLSSEPVTVFHGTGISRANAHNAAAHSALQYIKMMASIR